MSVNVESRPTYPRKYENRWIGSDVFGLYLHDMKKHPILPKDEVAQLSRRVQQGIAAQEQFDTDSTIEVGDLKTAIREGMLARNAIVAANTGLVIKWANRHRGRGVEYEDLVQAGNMGLIRAAEKFDPDTGFAFSTYATRWIRSTVEKEAHVHGRMIAVPLEESQSLSKLHRISREHETATGVRMSAEELAKAMGQTVEKINDMLTMEKPTDSLNILLGEDENAELGDYIVDRDAEPIEEQVTDTMLTRARQSAIRELLDNSGLSEENLAVVRLYYGFETGESMSQRKIASKLGWGHSRVDDRLSKALAILKSKAAEMGLNYIADESIGVEE